MWTFLKSLKRIFITPSNEPLHVLIIEPNRKYNRLFETRTTTLHFYVMKIEKQMDRQIDRQIYRHGKRLSLIHIQMCIRDRLYAHYTFQKLKNIIMLKTKLVKAQIPTCIPFLLPATYNITVITKYESMQMMGFNVWS